MRPGNYLHCRWRNLLFEFTLMSKVIRRSTCPSHPERRAAIGFWFGACARLLGELSRKDPTGASRLIEAMGANILDVPHWIVGRSLAIGRLKGSAGAQLAASIMDALESSGRSFVALQGPGSLHGFSPLLKEAQATKRRGLEDEIYSELLADNETLTTRVFATPLNFLTSFMTIAGERGRRDVLDAICNCIIKDPENFSSQSTFFAFDFLATFLVAMQERGKRAVLDATYTGLHRRTGDLVEKSFNAQLGALAAFLKIVADHDRHDLLAAVYDGLASDLNRLVARAASTPLDFLAFFFGVASEHDKSKLVDGICDYLVADPITLSETAFQSSVIGVTGFFRMLDQLAKRDLILILWRCISREAEIWEQKLADATPDHLSRFLAKIPRDAPEFGVEVLRTQKLESWQYGKFRSDRFSTGAPGLAAVFRRYNRSDLCEALLDNIIKRRNGMDFSNSAYGLTEMSRTLWLVSESTARLEVSGFLDAIVGPKWLSASFRAANLYSLSDALTSLADHNPPDVITRFHCKELDVRIKSSILQLRSGNDELLGVNIRLIAAAALVGRQVHLEPISKRRWDQIIELANGDLAHRPDKGLEGQQRQFWIGLRVIVSAMGISYDVPPSVLETTCRLWQSNLVLDSTAFNQSGGGNAGEPWIRKNDPSCNYYRFDKSMVRWLRKCIDLGGGKLVPDDEPVWTIAGF